MPIIDKVALFDHITEQHAEEATFLWMQRALAMKQVHHPIASLRKLDTRINNHLKGLFVNPQRAWEIALTLVENKNSEELFLLTMLAIHSGDEGKIRTALELGAENKHALKGMISALGWLSNDKINPLLKEWIDNRNIFLRHLAIAACSVRRIDPQRHLNALFNIPENLENISLYCRMLRLVGELKRHDLAPHLKTAQAHTNADVRFWAGRSALLLSDVTALDIIESYLLHTNTHQQKAIDIAFRCHSPTQAWNWINRLVKAPEQTVQTIIALAILGDPHGVNWLLARIEEPPHAKIASYAFGLLTGIDLLQEGLASYHSFSDDDDDMEIAIDDFRDLPTPHVEKIHQRWQKIRHKFQAGHRYFLGQPITPHLLQHTILHGHQGQRLSACLEFSLLNKNNAYPNANTTLNPLKAL